MLPLAHARGTQKRRALEASEVVGDGMGDHFKLDEDIFVKTASRYAKENLGGSPTNDALAKVVRRANEKAPSLGRAILFLSSELLQGLGDTMAPNHSEEDERRRKDALGDDLSSMVARVATFNPDALREAPIMEELKRVEKSSYHLGLVRESMKKRNGFLSGLGSEARRRVEEYRVVCNATQVQLRAFYVGYSEGLRDKDPVKK